MKTLSSCLLLSRNYCVLTGELRKQSTLYFAHRGQRTQSARFASLACCPLTRVKHCKCNSQFHLTFDFRQFRLKSTVMDNTTAKDSTNFKDYDVLGFDLDHTIAKYKLVKLFTTAYKCVTDFLVSERGYDPSIKDDLLKYKDFICKGLFLDVSKGNILKLRHDGKILRATHGTQRLSEAEVQRVYGPDMKWEQTEAVKRTLRNSACMVQGLPSKPAAAYRFFENYFDCPGLVATARIIDTIDKQNQSMGVEEREKLYAKAWKDTLDSLHNMYNANNFSAEKGGYFSIVKQDPSLFVEECSAEIKDWLKSLRKAGKMVFLLTSSQIDYASCLMDVCLGKDWQSYFDISLFRGRKPGFFTDNNPFYALENEAETVVVKELKRNGCYSQGNLKQFNEFLSKELGKKDAKVLYFGDNICSDAYPSKHYAAWGTVLVLEEMDAEGYLCSDGTVPGHQHDCDEEKTAKKRKFLEHSSLVTEEEINYLLTDFWGPFLVDEKSASSGHVEMNTFWGEVIGQYSDIAVPSLEYLARVPLDHSFSSFQGCRKNTQGFHPGRPSSLLP